jgi:hypothetical protein
MIFQASHQLLLSGNKMEKSNYKEWSVGFNGKTIKVSNWWNWEGTGSADLYLDDIHLDQNTEMLVNPNKAMLSKSEVSDDIKSIEVFSAGSFSIKLSIMVNGIVVLQDKLSLLDRFVKTFFPKK